MIKTLTLCIALATVGCDARKAESGKEILCPDNQAGFELQVIVVKADTATCIYQEHRSANKLRRNAEIRSKVRAGSYFDGREHH